ncbi:MAG: Rieske 2Fe-2S domain-containing protein [Nitriliruptorales bacterium]|nr:Rieske 2Fe-2S domain-containing protein [Nitriliruptorales bacterium]
MNRGENRPRPLEIIERRDPPTSSINDSIVTLTAIGAGAFALLFAVSLLAGGPVQLYGGALAAALMLLAVAVRRFFTGRYPDVTAVEPRDEPATGGAGVSVADVEPVSPRRSFLTRALIAATGLLGLSLLAPVASLGPSPGDTLRRTKWARGVRLVTGEGDPVRPADVATGGLASIWPEKGIGHERSSVLLIRLQQPPGSPTRIEWVVDDLVAYSKVCTHAGCPVALYRERDNALFCPCHQSTFDPARGAQPTFGPAARSLPQLPLGLDGEGYLVALGDFEAQVGPALPRG